MIRRVLAIAALAAALIVGVASPASAHTVAGTGATNYRTTLLTKPNLPGLRVQVIEIGSRFEATYTGRGDVIVLGYQGEPYLRIGGRGVFENLRSPATYINRTRNGETPPDDADHTGEPVWRKTSGGQTARWHDHRAHFMGNINPPAVRAAPGKQHTIVADWKIPFRYDGKTYNAVGDLVWVPGPSPKPYVAAMIAVAVIVLVAARRKPYAVLLAAGAVLIAIDAVHMAGLGFAAAGSGWERAGKMFSNATLSIPAWIVGIGGLWFLWKRRIDGFFALVFCGLIVAVVGGVADITVIGRSQAPFAYGTEAVRWVVASSLGLGAAVAIASALAIRRLDPVAFRRPDPYDPDNFDAMVTRLEADG